MKSVPILVLQVAVALLGVLVVAFLIFEPQVEGRNAQATQFEIYFHDPFLAYVYLASLPFFRGLYLVGQLLSKIRTGSVSSPEGVATIRKIKWCAGMVCVTAAFSLLFMIHGDPEDRPPGLALRLIVIFPSLAVALLAFRYERHLRTQLPPPPENGMRS